MNNLYIIGNGFDIHHGFQTQYSHFKQYLQKNNNKIYSIVNQYIFHEDDELWSDFENRLSNINKEEILDDLTDYIPSASSDEYFSDIGAFENEVEKITTTLSYELYKQFEQFITAATNQNIKQHNLLSLNSNSIYLSFNYSKTLEKHYNIDSSNILYLHGKISDSENHIILGHGIKPTKLQIQEEVPKDLSDEELEQWQEHMNDQFDLSYQLGITKINEYFSYSFKNTTQIIHKHLNFFSFLKLIQNIYILGHSLSDIDIPYFQKIYKSTNEYCQWHISYYSQEEYLKHKEKINQLGVKHENITMFKLINLV